ncbi:protein DEK [Salminus brasiliensis]|uniref:protein DEK n=1 Tax=Salminus brasiliensis TaxID=930266 RepID=UPI003B830741
MMDSVEVKMDLQEEHTKEEEQEESNKEEQDETWKQKSKSRMYQGEIIEGKREKKTVQRLDMQVPKPKEKPKIESIGKGDKLGDIARVNHAIGRLKAPLLKPLHKIIYDRPGAVASLRKHLRLFNGFPFEIDSDPYNKKREKMARLPKVQLKSICEILDIERSGNQAVLVDRIMQFLVNPTNSGKPVILKKKKKKKTSKDAKREKKTASKSKKQQVDPGKSKAIVTDSSSDEDDEDDDEDEGENKNKDTEKSSVSDSRKHNGEESDSEEEEEENVDSDDGLEDSKDEETPKSKTSSNKKKSSPKKPAKKAEDNSDLSGSDDDDEDDDESAEEVTVKKTKKKPSAQKRKPAPKTKKADSSSNRKRKDVSKSKAKSESSDEDDEPLIKLIKKPPTNEQLREKIKELLKTANLEEVTMKQICQQVYDLYPDFDLTNRKDLIKETVKSLIS